MKNDTFLRACRREKTDFTPVWLMRQAGRYMKEYRDIKSRLSFLEMCKTPAVAAEVTLQPLNRFDLDASIIFADILLPLEGMGVGFEFTADDGPVIAEPVRTSEQVDEIKLIDPEKDNGYLLEAIGLVLKQISIPLIGFSGAPFTLASYMIEGGHSKNYIHTKKMMYTEPEKWAKLMDKLVHVIVRYLSAQIRAGVSAIQIFDSWVGCLSPSDYERYVLSYMQRIVASIRDSFPKTPIIYFGTNTATLFPLIKQLKSDVIGVDWRIDIAEAARQIGNDYAVQGNMDPVTLFATPEVVEQTVKSIVEPMRNRPGYIFNLGHGIMPGTPVENVERCIDSVHKYSGKK